MRILVAAMIASLLPALTACATTQMAHADPAYPEARLYDPAPDAAAAIDAALSRAAANDKLVLIAMGANWCHDSRAFAGWMESDRFQQLISDRFELVYVNVGMPQTGDGFNLHIASRFGYANVEGTPTVLVVSPQGSLLNADTAGSWRNTSHRTGDAIYAELANF